MDDSIGPRRAHPNAGCKMTIEIQPDGSVAVSGPLGSKMICYGMLEAAKDAVREYVDENKRIVKAPLGMFPKRPLDG
jgi:hypothetical protein